MSGAKGMESNAKVRNRMESNAKGKGKFSEVQSRRSVHVLCSTASMRYQDSWRVSPLLVLY